MYIISYILILKDSLLAVKNPLIFYNFVFNKISYGKAGKKTF